MSMRRSHEVTEYLAPIAAAGLPVVRVGVGVGVAAVAVAAAWWAGRRRLLGAAR